MRCSTLTRMPGALRYQWPSSIACTTRPTSKPESNARIAATAAGQTCAWNGCNCAVATAKSSAHVPHRTNPAPLRSASQTMLPSQAATAAAAGTSQAAPGPAVHSSSAANVARPRTTNRLARKKPAGTSPAGVRVNARARPQPKRQRKSMRSIMLQTSPIKRPIFSEPSRRPSSVYERQHLGTA